MFYNLIRGILYPFIAIFLIFNSKKRKFVFKRLFQDFSILKSDKEYIWLHCSSVGEINLIDGLIKKIKNKFPQEILITVFTDTGYNTAIERYSNDSSVTVMRFPLDDLFILKRIIKTISIKYLVLVETELWPNLIDEVSKVSKIILVNGRISNKSFPRYKKIKLILKPLLNKISFFCMQSTNDKDRIINLGADKNKIQVTGNLKFDISFESFSNREKNNLKKLINPNKYKIFVAGSTRTGEEEILINVFKKLKNTLLVIVPRHLERIENIEKLLTNSHLNYQRFSDILIKGENDNSNIIIVDKMGILRKFYSICDISFVGGTLVNIGGHSLLEPLFYGKTPIFGHFLQNVKTISRDILSLNLGYKIHSEDEFLQAINLIETNPVSEDKINQFFKSNQFAAEKIIKIMEEE